MAVFLAAIPLAVFWPVFFKRELKRRRLETLRIQFKDAILCVSSCLTAGYSVENAFAAALSEVERLYGKDSMIFGELRQIIHKTKLNQSFEEALENFAERSGIEDIRQFADVFLAARRSGGELMRIIAGTADIIGEKLRLQEEIITMTAAKKFEQKLMSGVPVLITLYIELTSPGFFQVLYETLIGRALMTVCLAVYLTACYTAWKILEIEV